MSEVYFLRPVGQDGPVKIGCSRDPEGRLATYVAWSPIPLEIVATIDGDALLERQFHALFRRLHSHHEWFHAAPELTAIIAAVAAGTFDVGSLPDPQMLPTSRARKGWSPEAKQNQGLRLRILHVERAGFKLPAHIATASRYSTLESDVPGKREAAVQAIQAFLVDPEAMGATPLPYEWAEAARDEWRGRRKVQRSAATRQAA